MPRRLALLIGNSKFAQTDIFPDLSSPTADVQNMATILKDFGHFEITNILFDQNSEAIKTAIEDLYNRAQLGDLALLYFTGHGYKDKYGRMFFVASNTNTSYMLSTGIRETFIKDAMAGSSSRHRVVILDCCYSGAFIEGKKGGSDPVLLEELRGEATAILASSGRVQSSYEDKKLDSLFSHYLTEGIRTGEADENGDGLIEVDELFHYAEKAVRQKRAEQTPMFEMSAREGRIVIAEDPPEYLEKLRKNQQAQNLYQQASTAIQLKDWRLAKELLDQIQALIEGYRDTKVLRDKVNAELKREADELQLPPELQEAVSGDHAWQRLGAVDGLERLLHSPQPRMVNLAKEHLNRLARFDDSKKVSDAARSALARSRPSSSLPIRSKPTFDWSQGSSSIASFLSSVQVWARGVWSSHRDIVVALGILAVLGIVLGISFLAPPAATVYPDLVFTSDRDGVKEVYKLLPDGKKERITTSFPKGSWDPFVYQPGGMISYTSDLSGKREAYLIDNGRLTKVTNSPSFSESWDLVYSGGSNYLFTSNRDGKAEIYQLVKNGKINRVTNTPGTSESWKPVPSTIDNSLFFTSNRSGKREIYFLGPKGSLLRETYTPGNGESWGPSVSPSGNLYFTTTRDGKREIYLLQSNGKVVRMTHSPGNSESWGPKINPDGGFFFTSNRDGPPEVYWLKSDGKIIRVTDPDKDRANWTEE